MAGERPFVVLAFFFINNLNQTSFGYNKKTTENQFL